MGRTGFGATKVLPMEDPVSVVTVAEPVAHPTVQQGPFSWVPWLRVQLRQS